MDIFLDALWDAVKDSLLVVPFLYLTYLLVSYFSHNDNEKYSKILHKTNKAGPVIGAFLGCVPQCGFSSVMSNLFSKKMVTLGTLLAVFIATSDEAIPLMVSKPEFIPKLLILMAIKVIYAIIIGYVIDLIYSAITKRKQVQKEYHDKHCHANEKGCHHDEITHISKTNCDDCHHEEEEHLHGHSHCCATNIFLDALKHTAIILAYVFAVTLAINLIRGYCGGLDPLKTVFTNNVYLQILFAGIIGMIPNCASSVFLVELFMEGVIFFPALVAGLSAGAGVGLIVLYTCNYKKTGVNVLITILLYVLAIILGFFTNFIPFLWKIVDKLAILIILILGKKISTYDFLSLKMVF